MRTMQHLDPHSQALFRDQPDGHGEDVEFLTREMQMASLVSGESVVHDLYVWWNPRTSYHTAVRVTWM